MGLGHNSCAFPSALLFATRIRFHAFVFPLQLAAFHIPFQYTSCTSFHYMEKKTASLRTLNYPRPFAVLNEHAAIQQCIQQCIKSNDQIKH